MTCARAGVCFACASACLQLGLSVQLGPSAQQGPPAERKDWSASCHDDCPTGQPMLIRDARALQASSNLTLPEFFARYGFALLRGGDSFKADAGEALRALLPGKRTRILQDGAGAIRGPGEAGYSTGNHQDTSLNASGYQHYHNKAWPAEPGCSGTCGFDEKGELQGDFAMLLNFWGPCGMRGPLMHKPLAVMDPNSGDVGQVNDFTSAMNDWQVRTFHYSNESRWYYYPNMVNDEFMVFTHFRHNKGDDFYRPFMRSNLHGAFGNPLMPDGAELRRSCERRVALVGWNEGTM